MLVTFVKLHPEVHDAVSDLADPVEVVDEHDSVNVPVHPLPVNLVLELPQLVGSEYPVDAAMQSAFDLTELEERSGEVADLAGEIHRGDDAAQNPARRRLGRVCI